MGDDRMRQTEPGIFDGCRINSGRDARPGLIDGLRQSFDDIRCERRCASSFRASMSCPMPRPGTMAQVEDGRTVTFHTVAATGSPAACISATAFGVFRLLWERTPLG